MLSPILQSLFAEIGKPVQGAEARAGPLIRDAISQSRQSPGGNINHGVSPASADIGRKVSLKQVFCFASLHTSVEEGQRFG